ncbi:capsular biosynthesis protein [Bordetella holmesii]|uniref:capsular biosynthesis protein n=1 Tax=Bordetella holmesii TaxID=35814 RepID=UPI00045ACA17|nr:capsular biosynthesis protein [Bordetella holmesii]AUL41273.1 capsular biosynthesis protein [Bordetella holmesii]KCV07709.1 hypothetical protein L502_1408 [Bordetella holmesii CDC-H785-BH]MBO1247884.1 capsular biosynthesis protein [Bordetella holmesii]QGE26304.1 capsular biosynthesis protein [Bordetella holmesii]
MNITTIGSCRVAGPMAKVQARRNFVLDNRLLYGYTHNSKETIQAIRYMRGDLTIPAALWPFISGQTYREGNPRLPHGSIPAEDRHVVEISSIKVLELDGYQLQLVRFKEALAFCPELRKIFFEHGSAEVRAQRLRQFHATASYARAPEAVQHVLTQTVLRTQTAAEIESDLKQIALLLGPSFVLVTHCNAMNAHGELIADRAKMVDRVSRACARAGITLVDPGSLLAAYGQDRGMPEDGRDTTHYTTAFAHLVGKEICDKLLGVQETAALPEGQTANDWKQSLEAAKEYGQAQAWDLALLYANRAIELKPNVSAAYVLRARAMMALSQTDEVLDAWGAALAIDANRNAYILRQAAECAFEQGQIDTARGWAQESLQCERNEKTATLLGRIHARLGENEQAERAFRVRAQAAPERSLRHATRSSTPLEEGASMVSALAATQAVDSTSLQGAREHVLKRARREVRHAGRAGALLPSLGAFYALQILAGEHQTELDDEINQAYRRLLKSYETSAEYRSSEMAIQLLAELAALNAVDVRYVQRAAKQLQADGHGAVAVACWHRLAEAALPAESETVLLAATRLVQLGAHADAVSVYRRLANSGVLTPEQTAAMIEKNLRALARSMGRHLIAGNLRMAEQDVGAIRAIDPTYAGLPSLQRTLSDAHKREFQDQRQQSKDQNEVIASAKRVIESNPMDREANVELVMQSLRTGNLNEGRRLLERFMENAPA